jgi:MraZ protein
LGRKFRGEHTFKVDTKGRVSVPAPFRRVIEAGDPDYTDGLRPQFILVYGGEEQNYLEGYTLEEAQRLEDKINRLPSSPLKRKLIFENITQSHDAEIDPDGRLVLPARLRDKIGLDKEVVFMGNMATFRIWSTEAYAQHKRKEEQESDLGFGIPEGTELLDALDMALAKQGGD